MNSNLQPIEWMLQTIIQMSKMTLTAGGAFAPHHSYRVWNGGLGNVKEEKKYRKA